MRVKAIDLGYYNHRRMRPEDGDKPADVFEVNDEKDFSEKWMERVKGSSKVVQSKTVKQEAREPVPISEGDKAVHTGDLKDVFNTNQKVI